MPNEDVPALAPPRIAVIGAGQWGRNLVANLHALGALAAVAEGNEAIRNELAVRFPGIALYADHRELLESDSLAKGEATAGVNRADVAGVVVATPVPTHFAIARDAILAGKDVFVEKPLTLSLVEARDLVAMAQERGRVLMVGHLLLYQPAIQWIAAFLGSGGLGQVHAIHQERLNLGRARSVENVLWSFGVHDVAVILHLAGAVPIRSQVWGHRILQEDVQDDVHLHLEFPKGVQAHLHVSWLWPEKRRRLTIIGRTGMLVYDELEQTVTLHRKGIHANLVQWDEGAQVVFKGDGEPLKLELGHFLDRLRDRRAPISDGISGIEVMRVLDTASTMLEEMT